MFAFLIAPICLCLARIWIGAMCPAMGKTGMRIFMRRCSSMGIFFGGLHLAAGVYLYFTEKRRNES